MLNWSKVSRSLKHKFSTCRVQFSTGQRQAEVSNINSQPVELNPQPIELGGNPAMNEAGPTGWYSVSTG